MCGRARGGSNAPSRQVTGSERRSGAICGNEGGSRRRCSVGKGGRPLLRTSLTQLLAKLGKRTAWADKGCSPHMLRRSFAVEFIRAGGDPFRLQILMGHEKLDMTRLYAQALSMEDALASAAQFSPGDRL